jgi:Uma2 family endonuclease
MASHLPTPRTVDDFLEWEAQQPERYEFIDGMIVGMVGGSAAHTILKGNLFASLAARLRGGACRALPEGLKVMTPSNVHYPDVAVICTPIQPADDQIREPLVIIEVLSRTTGDRDRGAKWVGYRELLSLQHYVLVTQQRRFVEVYSREGAGWGLILYAPPLPFVPLQAIGVELSLDEIYDGSGA